MSDLLLSFYGDDFTGSTDALEALSSHGIRSILFTRLPTPAEYARFAGYEAVGLAGSSRSQTPAWMDANLRPAFAWLKSLKARLCHYKVCSTFDSSPTTGSIGKALDLGREVFGQSAVPIVVGTPQLRRFTAFGTLFAAYQGTIYRIDRHPVMSRHPVTPMAEADLLRHLALQTQAPMGLVSFDRLMKPGVDADVDATVAATPGGVFIDVIDAPTQAAAGAQLLRLSGRLGPFVIGASGVEYAVIAAGAGRKRKPRRIRFPDLPAAKPLLVVSGSCSPTTERQIRTALAAGFAGIAADPVALFQGGADAAQQLADEAAAILAKGQSVIVHTALGPETDRAAELEALPGARHGVGVALGRLARGLIERAGLKRVVFSGGDTSSHALGALDILALSTRFPLAASPGSPLCRVHSPSPLLDGLEVALKGGQLGSDTFFIELRDGLTA